MTALSEVSDLDTGLLLEVWEKGLLWDKVVVIFNIINKAKVCKLFKSLFDFHTQNQPILSRISFTQIICLQKFHLI